MGRVLGALVAGFVLAVAGDARADEDEDLAHDLRVDIPVTAGLAAVTVGFRLVRDDLEPSTCRWCDGSTPGEVNAVDDWFRTALVRPDTHPANVTSYVLAFGAAPLSAAGMTLLASFHEGRQKGALVDVLAIAEAGFTAMLVTEVVESLVLRTRPYVHAIGDDEERARVIAETGAFHSFPAGHVVGAFGMAAAAGTVASMRDYRLAPLVWGSGLAIGAATAYTRIAADRHYFTDVVAGAAIGTAIGVAVPVLFHPPVRRRGVAKLFDRASLFVSPVPGGNVVGIGGVL